MKKAVVGLVSSFLFACSGAAGTGLFGAPSADTTPTDTDSGSGQDGGTTLDAGGHDSAPPRDGTVIDVSAPDTSVPDTGPGDKGIRCASAECTVGPEVCCRSGPASAETFACTPQAACNAAAELPIPCDDEKDCETLGLPGTVCCATYQPDPLTQNERVTEVTCRSATECVQANSMVIVCALNVPSACPTGKTCKKSTLTFPGYDLCL